MQICPDLARPLGCIRDAVGQALYSNYCAASDGSLELKQLPYFAVVQRLEFEKSNLQQKYEECQKVCAAHGVRIRLIADGAKPHCGYPADAIRCIDVVVICGTISCSLPAATHACIHKLCTMFDKVKRIACEWHLYAGASARACLAAARVPAAH